MTTCEGLILVIPSKTDPERDRVADAWLSGGGEVLRLDRFWAPPAVDPRRVRLYGNDSFAGVLAQLWGLTLICPADDLLIHLPAEWLRREISIVPLAACVDLHFPCFIKPVVPKAFRAAVYADAQALESECRGMLPDSPVYVSEIVSFAAEARAFVWQGVLQDIALYEGSALLAEATEFAREVARSPLLPESCVLDFGRIPGRGWALIEANATWGAGLNGCRAERVLACIAVATVCNS